MMNLEHVASANFFDEAGNNITKKAWFLTGPFHHRHHYIGLKLRNGMCLDVNIKK